MIFLNNTNVEFFSNELLKYSVVGLFCAIFLITIVLLVLYFKKWLEEQNKVKDDRIKKLEDRLDYYEKNDRKEMLILIERSNTLHERNERLWEEVKIALIQTKK